MTSIELPIFGQGSQPLDEDGTVLEYLHMPTEMATYTMPEVAAKIPPQAKTVLRQLSCVLAAFPVIREAIDLTVLDNENRRFIDEILGEGEVGMLYSGERSLRIQESVLAGVWRLQTLDAGKRIVNDTLEVGIVPRMVMQSAFANADEQIDISWTALPPGVMNAPAVLTELNAKIAAYRGGSEPHAINLSLLPQTDADLAFLTQRLGVGAATILSRGYGNCRITGTAIENVWWVQYFNSQDALILNTLEVVNVPSVACAAAEDIVDSYARLQEILHIYG
jgi:hydrogenase-1 operon protein HyaF